MSEVRAVVQSEESVDMLEEELRERHIERLSSHKCTPENGIVFLEALSNLENTIFLSAFSTASSDRFSQWSLTRTKLLTV